MDNVVKIKIEGLEEILKKLDELQKSVNKVLGNFTQVQEFKETITEKKEDAKQGHSNNFKDFQTFKLAIIQVLQNVTDRSFVKDLLSQYKVTRLTELSPDNYDEFYRAVWEKVLAE